MDRAVLEQHLALGERHVSEGTDHVARQREIVAELIEHGHDSRTAQALMVQFEETLAIDIADPLRPVSEPLWS
jgi:hypothetical protein